MLTASRPIGSLTRRELFSFPHRRREDEPGHWVRVHRRAMACRFEVTLSGDDARHVPAARAALNGVDEIEDVLTVFRDSSEVSRVNREAVNGPVAVSENLFALLQRCRVLHQETGGAFDPTSAPLSRCWGFLAREGRLPPDEDIEAAMAAVGFEKVELEQTTRSVRFSTPGVTLNFGAIGKGYALDVVSRLLRQQGVGSALLSAGGSSVLAFGGGAGFRVDVRSPRTSEPVARLRLRDAALGTSGAGEQFFEVGGRRYGHVLDPRTGRPAEGVMSASVIAASAADADALSTAFLVAGPELAERYCATHAGTLALLALDGGEPKPLRIGSCEGAIVEEP